MRIEKITSEFNKSIPDGWYEIHIPDNGQPFVYSVIKRRNLALSSSSSSRYPLMVIYNKAAKAKPVGFHVSHLIHFFCNERVKPNRTIRLHYRDGDIFNLRPENLFLSRHVRLPDPPPLNKTCLYYKHILLHYKQNTFNTDYLCKRLRVSEKEIDEDYNRALPYTDIIMHMAKMKRNPEIPRHYITEINNTVFGGSLTKINSERRKSRK